MSSVWSEKTKLKKFDTLNGEITVDAAVIGGGLAGILTAYKLRERGVDSVVIEADEICGGQTKNTTAKITSQHGEIYYKLTKYYGGELARQYAAANENAIREFERIISQNRIECGFERKDAYLYYVNGENNLQKEYLSASAAGIDCRITDRVGLPLKTAGALVFANQAQFDPLEFVGGIIDGLNIYEHTKAVRIVGNRVYTPNARINAKNIVVATHYPFVNFPSFYFLKMSQERSYVLALERNGAVLDGMYIGAESGVLSFRSCDGYILLGGSAHRTGVMPRRDPFEALTDRANRLYSGHRVALKWSAQDCVTIDGIPYIGRFGGNDSSIFIATGFGKWGMTSSMVSADIISGMICGAPTENADIFSPRRFNLSASGKSIITNTKETVKGFSAHLRRASGDIGGIPTGSAREISYKGKNAGAYKDEQGRVYVVALKCPHLKCKLNWNDSTKTWDCPCHGSRYDYKGRLIDNPAQKGSILIAEL